MNHEKFEKILNHRINLIRKTLQLKNKEYASQDNKLHNFERAAKMLQQTPEQSLIGMWTKHIISLLDIVDHIDKENKRVGLMFKYNPANEISKELVEEKIGDAINYLILLEAMIKERY